MSALRFSAYHYHNKARLGEIVTRHGKISTPAFAFCATRAAAKSMWPDDLHEHNTQMIVCNTYHLMINPGPEYIDKYAGIHNFMHWNKPILTDSGGYQVFSLGYGSVSDEIKGKRNRPSSILSINEEGVVFRSYRDGSKCYLTPESSIKIQKKLGADLIVSFDECTPYNVSKKYTEQSMLRSNRWADRSIAEFKKDYTGIQGLYGVLQGGVYEDLRDIACDFINDREFFGIAIGGSLGQNKEQMYDVVNYTMTKIRRDRPVHLLGIGCIDDIFAAVKAGVDTLDCVHPTRVARHGGALVHPASNNGKQTIQLKNARYSKCMDPISSECQCRTCKQFSIGYLHYLLKADELLALQAISVHNVYFMNKLMVDIREGIKNCNLLEVEQKYIIL